MPEQGLDALRALAEAARGADSPEEARREALKVLADRSAELACELADLDRQRAELAELERAARERAADATEARACFMDTVSHELRTPLNGIIGYIELLCEGIGGSLTEAQARQVHRIRAGALRLKEMIEEILTFSRLEAGDEALELEDTDLGATAAEVAALVEPLMQEKGLAFEVSLPPVPLTLRTDGGKLRQILLNLLSNARKYTRKGRVELAVECQDGRASVQVRDTGPGIAPRDRERIFLPFQRLSNSERGGGTGLGLSVSRSLAELLGGDLTVESEPGSGSTFRVRLPLGSSPGAAALREAGEGGVELPCEARGEGAQPPGART